MPLASFCCSCLYITYSASMSMSFRLITPRLFPLLAVLFIFTSPIIVHSAPTTQSSKPLPPQTNLEPWLVTAGVLPRKVQYSSRVIPQEINKCIPNSREILRETDTIQCPCFVAFELFNPKMVKVAVDFLVMTEDVYNKGASGWNQENVEKEQSVFGAKMTASAQNMYRFTSDGMELAKEGDFRLVIRSAAGGADCGTTVGWVFEQKPPRCEKRIDSIAEPRVVGGDKVTDDRITDFMAFLQTGSGACTGSLVAPKWVLTAGHCRALPGVQVRIGGADRKSGTSFEGVRTVTYPSFSTSQSGAQQNDLALIELNDAMEGARPILLNRDGQLDDGFTRVAGFGRISENWASGAGTLQSVDIPIVPFNDCVDTFEAQSTRMSSSLQPSKHLCAGFIDGGGCDSCQGDSGGPLFLSDNNGSYVQLGIVSSGIGCARSNSPGIYTRVSSYIDWIEETTKRSVTVVGKDNPPLKASSSKDRIPVSTIVTAVGGGLAAIAVVVVALWVGSGLRSRRRQLPHRRSESHTPDSAVLSPRSPHSDDGGHKFPEPVPYGAQTNFPEQGGRALNPPPVIGSHQLPPDFGTSQSLGFYPATDDESFPGAPPPTIAEFPSAPFLDVSSGTGMQRGSVPYFQEQAYEQIVEHASPREMDNEVFVTQRDNADPRRRSNHPR